MSLPLTGEEEIGLTQFEMLGALSARLVHALSNHLAVIGGNAQFARQLTDNALPAAGALDAAIKASDIAGELVARFAEVRRQMPDRPAKHRVAEVLDVVGILEARHPGWRVLVADELRRDEVSILHVPARWIAFCVDSICRHLAPASGDLRLARGVPPGRIAGAPFVTDGASHGGCLFCFEYAGDSVFSWEDARARFSDWNLVAVYELMREARGSMDARTIAADRRDIRLWFPFAPSA